MDKLIGYLDRIIVMLGAEKANLHVAIKIIIIVIVAFILWRIVKRVFSFKRLSEGVRPGQSPLVKELSFEKRKKMDEIVKIKPQISTILRKVLIYTILLIAGAFLIRAFDARLIENAFYALFIILVATPLKDFLLIVLTYFQQNVISKTDSKIDDIIFDLLCKFTGVIIYAIAILLALDVLGINVMPFVAGAGVVGIAIGFAAKDTLSNLIAGVLLIIDRPFEIGDRIEVWSAPIGSATWGDVIDIGLRATSIKTTDNIVIIIPNNEIMKRDIVNYTIITSKIRVRVNIGVAYETNIEKAKAVIIAVAETAQWVAKDPPAQVVVRNFGESSVDLQLRVWIKDARKRMDTISYITDKVKGAFDKAGIEIPYPKRDIFIHNR